jgi:hypothetical protein
MKLAASAALARLVLGLIPFLLMHFASNVRNQERVRLCHKAHIDADAEHVRFLGVKRTSTFGIVMSANDP